MSRIPVKTDEACPHCAGTGRVLDDGATGKEARWLRRQVGLTAGEVAARMGISAQYVCDLEYGRRAWTLSLLTRYLAALAAEGGSE